ncbi:MAG: DNA-binding protein, partial [Candidatus Binatia bacterium]
MKKTATAVMILGVSTLLLTTDALAQGFRWRGGGGWGAGGQYGRLYDVKTVETVSGEVSGVQEMTPSKGMGRGVHLMLKTDKETISVHLGPVWYVEHQDTKIAAGDKI